MTAAGIHSGLIRGFPASEDGGGGRLGDPGQDGDGAGDPLGQSAEGCRCPGSLSLAMVVGNPGDADLVVDEAAGDPGPSLPQKVVTSAVVVSVQLSAGSGHVGGRPGGVGTYLKQKLLLEDSLEQESRPIESSQVMSTYLKKTHFSLSVGYL